MHNTRSFSYALKLAKHGNFARAAKALNISQPTLTRSIQMLEKSVGERLFDRGRMGVSPTQAGEIVLKHARMIVASSESMVEEIDRHQGVLGGSLNIGSGSFPGTALLPLAIGRFNRRFPQIDISVSVDNWTKLPNRLLQREFDFVLAESSQLDGKEEFELVSLHRHQGFFYCRTDHPLLKRGKLGISDLAQYPLMFTTMPKRLVSLFDSLFSHAAENERSSGKLKQIFSNDQAQVKTTVMNSDVISIATFGMLASELKAGLLTALPFRISGLCTGYDIVKRKGLSLSPSAIAFIEVLIEIDEEQSVLEANLVKTLGHVIVA